VKAWKTRLSPRHKAVVAEAASKEALRYFCAEHGWKVAFFEGKTGSPRTGIVDAVMVRIAKGKSDCVELRLVQLKGGKAGISGPEIKRLKAAVDLVNVDWVIAAYDGESLHLVPDVK
jgi:hypothetical protein